MTSWECYENKWFYMNYIGKMEETESLLSTCCSIDRQLNLPQYPSSNNYFSQYPRRKYIINNWGLMKKNYFGWSGVYFIFMLYNCYVPTYHRFFTANIASPTSKRHLSAYLNIFPWFFKKFNTSCTKKIL